MRLIGIGGSAGGHEAILEIVQRLSPSLDAAVLVTVHLRADAPTNLPAILGRATLLDVTVAEDDQRLEAGRVFVAPPDRHLCVDDGRLRLDSGPKINALRPAVDPMLTSMAATGWNAAGVIVSGAQDDGARGLRDVAEAGGQALVQDPDTALHPSMSLAALDLVKPDLVAAPHDLARHLSRWARSVRQPAEADAPGNPGHSVSSVSVEPAGEGHPSLLTCPLCHGVLREYDEHGRPVFACHIGHVFNPESLVAANGDDLEETLMTAVRTMHERAHLFDRLGDRSRDRGLGVHADAYATRAASLRAHATSLADIVGWVEPPTLPRERPEPG